MLHYFSLVSLANHPFWAITASTLAVVLNSIRAKWKYRDRMALGLAKNNFHLSLSLRYGSAQLTYEPRVGLGTTIPFDIITNRPKLKKNFTLKLYTLTTKARVSTSFSYCTKH